MGTKVRNLRMTQTKQSLIKAFVNLVNEKDFEKITIADLTERAQVNRATFYAHFHDKYELLDYIVGDSASTAIMNRTKGEVKFDKEGIAQLVLALCDFYQQPNINCRRSYVALVVPQLKDKAIKELNAYLLKGLQSLCSQDEIALYTPVFAQMIHESAFQWATGNIALDKEEIAKKVALLVVNGFSSSVSSLS
ncbi:TetR/AcrR family transcriptional regulator [Paenibacillus thiaminolyticus]|uniref:TetR/AcrR family transcriptional regulator n=1 Tax=Paenibacillus thiaminolyticus TaxID=49283 RepID=A0A3A3GXN9_PANTH|nr:TetR/AcrR family transcriptional regulator [Paenibacillus thiaminolyticus]RJG20786.1 TetR/AcrR family transcriptional regulator [Paenibacillus thiaminolyticus]